MTERPLLATGFVVRAILDGRQTEDRRPVKGALWEEDPVPLDNDPTLWVGRHRVFSGDPDYPESVEVDERRSPFGQPGDLLYVRETWAPDTVGGARYAADGWENVKWRPSIHMPKRLARIWLRVERVWVERVQDITADGCLAEGIPDLPPYMVGAGRTERSVRLRFSDLWESIYPGSWERNDWVWACRFTVASTTGRPA